MAEADTSPPERLRALQLRWESDKTSRVFVQLAEEYRRLGRTQEALGLLAEGLAAHPNYLAAQVVLGRCHLDLGRTKEAIAELEGVIARDPTQMVAYKLLVEAHLAEQDGEEARKRLRIYSLLNDSDPEIADLRRRIGEVGRHRRDPEDTFVGALRAETPAVAAPEEAPVPIATPEPANVPLELEVPEPKAAEPPVEAPAVFDELPFPDLAVQPERYHAALPDEPLFDLALPGFAPPEVAPQVPEAEIVWQFEDAPAPTVAGPEPDLFELDALPVAADLDVTGLLGRVTAAPEPLALFDLEPAPTADVTPAPQAELPEPVFELPAVDAVEWTLEPEVVPEPEAAPVPFSLELPSEPEVAAAPEAADLPAVEAVAEPTATATLGHLYLRQGHHAEAEAIFREVLDREPDNGAAAAGLAEIRRLSEPSPPPVAFAEGSPPAAEPAAGPLTAATLLAGFDAAAAGDSPVAKKRYLLRGYLARLTGARGSHVR
ncbi:MAG: tetratricopeptide repeat protein [Thermoanaerobaculia bacterium]|nr:tetratricopeptide repeat protein [Thermoanaerobaculia bacterium]